jgi:hypothetical protein
VTNPANPAPLEAPVLTHSRLRRCDVNDRRERVCLTDREHIAVVAVTWHPCGHVRYYCERAWKHVQGRLDTRQVNCGICQTRIERWDVVDLFPVGPRESEEEVERQEA